MKVIKTQNLQKKDFSLLYFQPGQKITVQALATTLESYLWNYTLKYLKKYNYLKVYVWINENNFMSRYKIGQIN